MSKQRIDRICLSLEDFPNALDVHMENGWITVVLPTCRVKFKNWVSE